MARSNSSNDTALGCAALLGIAVLGVVCWLVWSAVMWLTAEWRWAWICGCALLVPGLAYAVVRAWGEQRPFVPAVRREAWITAVLTAVAAAAPVVGMGDRDRSPAACCLCWRGSHLPFRALVSRTIQVGTRAHSRIR
jgi:hypothetical protein